MDSLTPASAADLPPLGELAADEPFWSYPAGGVAGAGVAHLRVWLTAGPEPGHLAVVTEIGPAVGAAGQVARRAIAGFAVTYALEGPG